MVTPTFRALKDLFYCLLFFFNQNKSNP
jgi:hypothetical protein